MSPMVRTARDPDGSRDLYGWNLPGDMEVVDVVQDFPEADVDKAEDPTSNPA